MCAGEPPGPDVAPGASDTVNAAPPHRGGPCSPSWNHPPVAGGGGGPRACEAGAGCWPWAWQERISSASGRRQSQPPPSELRGRAACVGRFRFRPDATFTESQWPATGGPPTGGPSGRPNPRRISPEVARRVCLGESSTPAGEPPEEAPGKAWLGCLTRPRPTGPAPGPVRPREAGVHRPLEAPRPLERDFPFQAT